MRKVKKKKLNGSACAVGENERINTSDFLKLSVEKQRRPTAQSGQRLIDNVAM